MGNSIPRYSLRFNTYVHTNTGRILQFSHLDLVEHVLLLRRVIAHPQLAEQSDTLHAAVNEYCYRMGNKAMFSSFQQETLPWQIDWIWHVHRLHPVAYLRDCQEQIPGSYVIDKRTKTASLFVGNIPQWKSIIQSDEGSPKFKPSIDLVQAVLRQGEFLKKFRNHPLYSANLNRIDQSMYDNAVQNYVSFMKLARSNTIIVPTFDIDLIWHTTMRYPLNYIELSTALCGHVLDHDDSIPSETLQQSYETTAERWKTTYLSNYGETIDRDYLSRSIYPSSCAMIYKTEEQKKKDAQTTSSGGGCGGFWESKKQENQGHSGIEGDSSDSGDGGGGDGGCGGGCGGD